MASFMPPASKQTNQVGYQQQRYDSTKKINGTMGPPPGVGPTPSQPQTSSPPQQQMAMKVRPTSGQPQTQDMNGIAVIDALTNPGSGSGVANAANQSGGNGPQNFSGIYGNDADNYLPPTVVAPGGGHGGRPDMSNGLYGQHELVAAISQITAEPPTAVGQQPQQQNKAFNKAKKLWSASEAAGGQPDTTSATAATSSSSPKRFTTTTTESPHQKNNVQILNGQVVNCQSAPLLPVNNQSPPKVKKQAFWKLESTAFNERNLSGHSWKASKSSLDCIEDLYRRGAEL